MANFYLDTPELKHHLNHPLMKRIVELKERNYADKDKFDYAPVDFRRRNGQLRQSAGNCRRNLW